MADDGNEIETIESQIPKLAASAFAAARERVLTSGQSVLQSEHDCIYEVFPDGRRVFVKRIEPPTVALPGSKFMIC